MSCMYQNFSEEYKNILFQAEQMIKQKWYEYLEEWDVFLTILSLKEGKIKELLDTYGINEEIAREVLEKQHVMIDSEERKWEYKGIGENLKKTILSSVKIAISQGKLFTSIEDFLLALLKNNQWFSQFLHYLWIYPENFEKDLFRKNQYHVVQQITNNLGDEELENIAQNLENITEHMFQNMAQEEDAPSFENTYQSYKDTKAKDSKTPALDFFSKDLTAEARENKIDRVIERDMEIERLLAILNRKTKNNPVLIGDPGVGKTAIVEGLALRIAEGNVPFSMKDKRILALDMSSLIAGTKYRWEFESRIKQVIEEASKVENEVILFIDEIHTIIGAWAAEWTLDASNILKPAMGRGKIRIIGATTYTEYQKYIEKDPALERRFQKIIVKEPSRDETLRIIQGLKSSFEEYHNLNITEEALQAAVDLSIRYITDRFLPDKAIDVIDEACALKSMKYTGDENELKEKKEKIAQYTKMIESFVNSQQYKKASQLKLKVQQLEEEIAQYKRKFSIPKEQRLTIEVEDIQHVLSIMTGIPCEHLKQSEIERIKSLPTILWKHIIGQEEAIEAVVNAIMRSKTGISYPNKPLGTFLFLWPTGVGKTELVKVLAKELYGDGDNLIKIDMTEYADKMSISKLIGASAWYVGYEEWGILTEKVRRKPYSIVLFDEIEKANYEVCNLLLQILDEGTLEDNKGRKVNFKNTIIVMTSNFWQEEFNAQAQKIGFHIDTKEEERIFQDFDKTSETIKKRLIEIFPQEFINRIDKIIVFKPLDKKSMKLIIKKQLDELVTRIWENKHIQLEYSKNLVPYILKQVYNPELGAREVKRYIWEHIETWIAKKLIEQKKIDRIYMSVKNNTLVIE